MNQIQRAISSSGFLVNAIRLLRDVPGLLKWAMVPFIIDMVLIFLFIGWGVSSLTGWVSSALGFFFTDPSGILYTVLYYPLFLLFGLGFFVIIIYGVFLISTVVASPFNAILAEKTLTYLNVIRPRKFELGTFIVVSLKMMFVSLVRAILFGVVGLFIFVLSFVPLANLGASFGAFLIIAFDSMDYSYEVLEFGLRQRLDHFKRHFAEFSGMAGVMGLTLLIPGLTLLVLPLSVVGAAEVLAKTMRRH